MALRNKDLGQISRAYVVLGMIWAYAIEPDSDLYEKTGVTSKDIHDSMTALNRIYIEQKLIKKTISAQSTEYKKIHKERRNLVQNINNAKKRHDKKKLEYWTQQLNEFDNKGGR